VVWVDAGEQIRYERITSRNKGTEDQVTFEEFLAEEKTQSQHSGDKATLNLSGVKAKADVFVENNSDIKTFKTAIEGSLKEFL
jgi:dephospho-CoA kinase